MASSGFDGLGDPVAFAAAVVTNDSVDLLVDARALYVGGAGNIAMIMVGGSNVTLVGVPAGTVLPFRVRRVLATGTTATSILALR